MNYLEIIYFVSDRYIKKVRILLNIEAKIPFILMGEIGIGKTKLFEVFSKIIQSRKLSLEDITNI